MRIITSYGRVPSDTTSTPPSTSPQRGGSKRRLARALIPRLHLISLRGPFLFLSLTRSCDTLVIQRKKTLADGARGRLGAVFAHLQTPHMTWMTHLPASLSPHLHFLCHDPTFCFYFSTCVLISCRSNFRRSVCVCYE